MLDADFFGLKEIIWLRVPGQFEVSCTVERTREKTYKCAVHPDVETDTYKCGKQGCHLGKGRLTNQVA